MARMMAPPTIQASTIQLMPMPPAIPMPPTMPLLLPFLPAQLPTVPPQTDYSTSHEVARVENAITDLEAITPATSGEDERPLNGDRLAVRRVRGDLFWDASSFAVTSLRVCFAACDAGTPPVTPPRFRLRVVFADFSQRYIVPSHFRRIIIKSLRSHSTC
jgi:hypothetical protein